LEGLLAVVGLEVTMEGIGTGTGMKRWRERVPDFRGCNTSRGGSTSKYLGGLAPPLPLLASPPPISPTFRLDVGPLNILGERCKLPGGEL